MPTLFRNLSSNKKRQKLPHSV